MGETKLPFYVGQEVEAKTFEEGFRGAWFRCKILKISLKKGETWFDLKYFDFPEEEIAPTKAYQYPEHVGSVNGRKKHLMVRPKFPTVYRKSEMPNTDMISEEAVIVDDDWRVGDVVDWWTTFSFWTGTVTGFEASGEIKIMLLPPPVGEGGEDSALSKDLRPTLNWSLENGWTVRSPRCGKLIMPPTNGPQSPSGNPVSAYSMPQEDDTLENIVSDLVELSCQMRRMKGIVKMGVPSAKSSLPSWKFVEHRAPPM